MILTGCGSSRTSITSSAGRGQLVFVDQSDNAYILRGSRSLVKYNYRNVPTDRYDFDVSVRETGLSTDLRFFAFNRDFQKFYILDQYLNEVSRFAFSDNLDFMAEYPILADGHMIWLYNPSENKLEKYTTQLEPVTATRTLSYDIPRLKVDQLLFHKNQVFLNDFGKGVYVFDYSGRLIRQILLPVQTRNAQIDHHTSRLYAYFRNDWYFVDLYPRIPETEKVILPSEVAYSTDLIFQNGKIYRWNTEAQAVEQFSTEN